jgi:hypothetical protein
MRTQNQTCVLIKPYKGIQNLNPVLDEGAIAVACCVPGSFPCPFKGKNVRASAFFWFEYLVFLWKKVKIFQEI